MMPTLTITCFKETFLLNFQTTNFLPLGFEKNSSDVLKFSDYYETCITNFHPFEGTSKNNSPSLLHDNY